METTASQDPKDYPHHFIVRKKGATSAPRVRAFHLTTGCKTLEDIAADHEIVDAPLDVIQFLGMTPCVLCLRDTNSTDALGLVQNVVDAVHAELLSGGHVGAQEAAELIGAVLNDAGYAIRKMRKPPARAEVPPLDEWLADRRVTVEVTGRPEADAAEEPASNEPRNPEHVPAAEVDATELINHVEKRHSVIVTTQTADELNELHVSMHDTGTCDHDLFDLSS